MKTNQKTQTTPLPFTLQPAINFQVTPGQPQFTSTGTSIPSNTIPKPLVEATCEMARELLVTDRTAAPPGEGISSTWDSYSGTKYDKTDTRPIISRVAQALLSKYGTLLNSRTSQVRLIRV